MIKAIAAFFSKMRMGYCTLVNGTVSDTSMQISCNKILSMFKTRRKLYGLSYDKLIVFLIEDCHGE